MKVTFHTNTLKEKLELVSKVSTKHVTLPVLQCVLLEVTKNKVVLKATNLEIGIEVELEANTEEEGVVAVSASLLTQTVFLCNQAEVTLKTEGEVLVVESKNSTTEINTIPAGDFPLIPKVSNEGQRIQKETFVQGIKAVAFSASQSSIKPELGSVFIFQKKEHSLTFVATDSFRLMEKTVVQKGVVFEDSVLIPHKNALELVRVMDSSSGDPLYKTNENQLALLFDDGVYITSRLTNGSFPDYAQIIPKEYVSHSTVLKEDLAQTYKKTNIFLNKFFQVGVIVSKDDLTVSANSGELGTATESVSANTEGEDLTLSFNQRYLSEPLSHINDESIVLHFAGVGRPMVIEGVNDKTFRYLVMPMNK
ncbi:DNA polymerase III subunit beta [bacterium]|nr:DNA polymerase III subunit beta [bacterium]|tara:strand:+ start:2654 stop:3748 length:1095 start_codon:yes stop_codon:yes gene_type:complete